LPHLDFLCLFGMHYVNRGLIYPLRTRGSDVSLMVAVFGLLYNLVNGALNAIAVFHHGSYPHDTVFSARFVIGLAIWLTGFLLNLQSDEILLKLRKQRAGYQIPRAGM